MAVSGSKDFALDVAEYIEEAFERCGSEVRTGYDLKTAKRSLNLLLADWSNRGLNRWTIEQKTLTLADSIADYPLGALTMTVGASGSFTVGETLTGGTSAATASITSKPSSTTMAITVPSGTFTNGETLTGGTSAATTTLSSAVDLTDVQASIDVLSMVVREDNDTSSQSDIRMSRVSRDDFISIPSKRTTGKPTQFYIDRSLTPVIKLWPMPDSSTKYVLVYDRLTRMDDADTFTNSAEVPFRFYPCLVAGLSYYLSIKRAPDRVPLLKAAYEEEFQRAASEDRDRASLSLTPGRDYYSVI
jgi:hypothetical protein|tara:strand:+ start:921 stop:1826 length:906 start_codon:yes stop_codon:yes gene_type:complete